MCVSQPALPNMSAIVRYSVAIPCAEYGPKLLHTPVLGQSRPLRAGPCVTVTVCVRARARVCACVRVRACVRAWCVWVPGLWWVWV